MGVIIKAILTKLANLFKTNPGMFARIWAGLGQTAKAMPTNASSAANATWALIKANPTAALNVAAIATYIGPEIAEFMGLTGGSEQSLDAAGNVVAPKSAFAITLTSLNALNSKAFAHGGMARVIALKELLDTPIETLQQALELESLS